MKIYLASRYVNKDILKVVRSTIEKINKTLFVNTRWLDTPEQPEKRTSFYSYQEATRDLDDIKNCDLFILFPHPHNTGGKGMYIEFGYALAFNKKIWIVNHDNSIFYYTHLNSLIQRIVFFESWLDVFKSLKEQK